MRWDNGHIVLSASDLMRFQACQHAITLDLRLLAGDDLVPGDASPEAEILQRLGDEHEKRFLAEIAKNHADIVTVDRPNGPSEDVFETTLARLREGASYIYQAALKDENWAGYADFLERVPKVSKLGSHSYEIIDTKLKRSVDPKHVLQLALYSDLLALVQGIGPEYVHLVLGDGSRVSLRLLDYAAYARNARRRLERFVAAPRTTRPEPVAACSLCRWREHCSDEWDRTDDLCLVAGITKSQRKKLAAAGVQTLSALAQRVKKVAKLPDQTLQKLREQARLQHLRRSGGAPAFTLKPFEPARGLARLPKPALGDLFFDMEGDPFIPGGREYLFGILVNEVAGPRFLAFWAHDAEAERTAATQVLDFFDQHLKQFPAAHIYHYNHYEVTALKRLASLYGVREHVLDQLLRAQKFVDLYRVVQQGLYASEPGYSLKDLEAFYMDARTESVSTAADSVIAYEEWLVTHDDNLLEAIRQYNETDCRSTLGLRDWLVASVRPADMQWYEPPTQTQDAVATAEATEAERDAWRSKVEGIRSRLGPQVTDLLVELPWFHQREDKPAWWAMFDRAERESEELIDDLDSLGGLVAQGPAVRMAKSLVRSYSFPEQETKLREESRVRLRDGLTPVSLQRLDLEGCVASVKFGPSVGSPPQQIDLIPGGPINNDVLRRAVRRVASSMVAGHARYPAIDDLLNRRRPRLKGHTEGPIIDVSLDVVGETVRAIGALGSSCLPIQGPPGTGKTYVSSQAILALIREGRRVAVTSNSHKAIDNLLLAVAARARESRFPLEAVKRGGSDPEALEQVGIEVATDNDDDRLASYPLVGGTAWLFAREEYDHSFDYLFIEEAGQISLANVVAAGAAARNLVLVGDPMQLPQPTQGVHPGETGKSSLEYALVEHTTVPVDRGIFLPVSRRMHPNICRYVSDLVYESRLRSDEKTGNQRVITKITCPALPETGIVFWGVEHDGNSQSAPEEARLIAGLFDQLRAGSFVDRDNRRRGLTISDILVITPYNAQVNLLKRTLPAGARVGTVDKFQGQEAPVCIVSMATSGGDEMPRNIDFLFSRNRLNVAVSRAQALAIVVASERLLEVQCRDIEEMKLVNALCALRDYATLAISK